MISYLLRLIDEFKHEHGCQPNLLYLNELHLNHLKAGFSEDFTLPMLCEIFAMELIVNQEVIHPHVAWTPTADNLAI